MRLRDGCFECLLGFAVLVTLMNLLLASAQDSIMVDTAGRPLGFPSRVDCPSCRSPSCYVTRYPVYRCRTCERRHAVEVGRRPYPHLAGIGR
jgi:hypothetical protein